MKFPIIYGTERIIRHIYSTKNINPNNNSLKANFVQFRWNPETNRYELSCNRFEFETIEHCRLLGKQNEDLEHNREYYGMGCILASTIQGEENYELVFTPILDRTPPNYTHCDICDNSLGALPLGDALPANVNFQRELFKKKWKPYKNKIDLKKKEVQPL